MKKFLHLKRLVYTFAPKIFALRTLKTQNKKLSTRVDFMCLVAWSSN
jgi:hypothetical protein